MRYSHVQIAALGHALPEERVTSEELETRLLPLYERLRLRVGRLELMTGIRERRFWAPGTLPSQASIAAAEDALARSGFDRERISCLVHASVCRDFLEPATASVVHHGLGLRDDCEVYDLSNACLGVMNAMVQVANRIELGQIEAGLIVAGEDGRALVEETIEHLVTNDATTKNDLKQAFASLTIGAGGAAVLLARDVGEELPRLVGGRGLAATNHNDLCQGDRTEASSGVLMQTDSEGLLLAGTALAGRTFESFLRDMEWDRSLVERVVTHQVGAAHRKLTLETLGLDVSIDYATVETLGNMGSVSLPLTLSKAAEDGFIERGQRVALVGIGSGLNCQVMGVEW